MAHIVFDKVNKIYDKDVHAVHDFSLEVQDKEFVVFVGPSGCGKSTTLRMLAGLEDISSGEIYIDDELVNDLEPKDRGIAMVFQNYALYPHMTVFDNMAFALKIQHMKKDEIKKKVEAVAETLGLTEYLYRKPKALSGGQCQRVSLGRAIVREPKVFLMDEPLSNLDAKLRVQMRTEISNIHKRVGATTIYVTHDQTEAMTMADRIVVMKDGFVQQIGSPREIYNNPINMFVGGFLGAPAMNFITGTFTNGKFVVKNEENKESMSLFLSLEQKKKLIKYDGKEIVLGVRPEDVKLSNDCVQIKASDPFTIRCELSELLGHELLVYGYINEQRIISKMSANNHINSNDINSYCLDLDKLSFFDIDTQERI